MIPLHPCTPMFVNGFACRHYYDEHLCAQSLKRLEHAILDLPEFNSIRGQVWSSEIKAGNLLATPYHTFAEPSTCRRCQRGLPNHFAPKAIEPLQMHGMRSLASRSSEKLCKGIATAEASHDMHLAPILTRTLAWTLRLLAMARLTRQQCMNVYMVGD